MEFSTPNICRERDRIMRRNGVKLIKFEYVEERDRIRIRITRSESLKLDC